MHRIRTLFIAGILVSFALNGAVPAIASESGGQDRMLRGRVWDQGQKERNGLGREDLPGDIAPAPDDSQQLLVPTRDMMKMDPVGEPNKPPFNLRANQNGNGNSFVPMTPNAAPGNPFEGVGENLPPMPFQQQPAPQQIPYAVDPDSTPEMQLLWDIWHHRVAEAIFVRFNYLAKVAFKCSPALLCKVSYTVTRDGHIQNIQVQERSQSMLFNLIVSQTVKSLDGDAALLQFPPNSRRMIVAKNGTFTQNYGGDGFKYTTGDKETIPVGQVRQPVQWR